MTRLLGAVVLLVAVSAGSAAPVPKSLRPKAPNLVGTTWVSDEDEVKLGVIEYTFHEGGKLTWRNRNGTQVWTEGSWTQEGDHLYWEVNQKYVDYNADFAGGQFEGLAVNKNNLRWKITLTPKAK
jgi:hypothetical protein